MQAEISMYGALIVVPPEDSDAPQYDAKVVDEIDSSWHTLPWTVGTCDRDIELIELTPITL